MASFQVLNEEKKLLRRKEKEAERQIKIKARMAEVSAAPGVSSWADASDEEDEIFKPISDSETESDDDEDQAAAPDRVATEALAVTSVDKAAEAKLTAKQNKQKKDTKKDTDKPIKVDEDIDSVLAEFGIDLNAEQQQDLSSRRRRKKDLRDNKENREESSVAKQAGDEEAHADKVTQAAADGVEEVGDEEVPLDPAARQAALEALKKKQAQKGKKVASSDAMKLAAAEAKKKAEKKVKKDKSGYDR